MNTPEKIAEISGPAANSQPQLLQNPIIKRYKAEIANKQNLILKVNKP